MTWVWLSAWLVAALPLEGEPTCPSREEVSLALESLSPPLVVAPKSRVRLESDSDGLLLSLHASSGDVLATRRLARGGRCEDLAKAAAVVVMTWQLQFQPAPSNIRWDLEVVGWASSTLVPSPSTSSQKDSESASLAWAWGGTGAASVGARSWPWAFRFGLGGLSLRRVSLGPGQAGWFRLWLLAGARWRLWESALRLDAQVDILGALLSVTGRGYPKVTTSLSVDPGVGMGVTLSAPTLGRVFPMLSLGARFWPRPHTVSVTGWPQTRALPAWELLLGVGGGVDDV